MRLIAKPRYEKPLILQEVEFILEPSLLAGSIVDSMNKGGVYTTPQTVEHEDFSTGSMNFKWEDGDKP